MYSRDQLDRRHYKLVVNTMKMLYLFLSLFASQLLLASPLMIKKEQVENRVEILSSEINKTASESSDPKAHPFLIMERQKAPSEASSLGHNQAKCKRDNFIVLIVLFRGERRFLPESSLG